MTKNARFRACWYVAFAIILNFSWRLFYQGNCEKLNLPVRNRNVITSACGNLIFTPDNKLIIRSLPYTIPFLNPLIIENNSWYSLEAMSVLNLSMLSCYDSVTILLKEGIKAWSSERGVYKAWLGKTQLNKAWVCKMELEISQKIYEFNAYRNPNGVIKKP